MSYRRSPEADEDYYAIYQIGLQTFGAAQAERYADRLDHAFGFLAEFPRAARSRHEIDPPIRAYPVKSHIVIYQIEADESITILRIRHSAEDWQSDPI